MYIILKEDAIRYQVTANTAEEAATEAMKLAQKKPGTSFVSYKADKVFKTQDVPVDVTSTETLDSAQFDKLLGKVTDEDDYIISGAIAFESD